MSVLLSDLGTTKRHGCPIYKDNPYSEGRYKTCRGIPLDALDLPEVVFQPSAPRSTQNPDRGEAGRYELPLVLGR